MKVMIQWFLDRSLLVNLISIMIVVVGAVSVYFLQKETFPNVDFDVVLIRANYPGSSSEDVEKLVTLPIERSLKEVDGIEELNAMSAEGASIIYMTIDPAYHVDDVLADSKDAIERINDFPEEVDPPLVMKLANKNRPVIRIALMSEDEAKLRVFAKDVRDDLEEIKGIARVDLDGYRNEIIDVALDPKKLEQYELTVGEVTSSIKNRNLNLSAGTLKTATGDVMVRTKSEFKDGRDVADVIVRSNLNGQSVKVKDVGVVQTTLLDNDRLQRALGKPAIYAVVKIQSTADILSTVEKVKKYIEKKFEGKEELDGIGYVYADDMSFFVKRRLSVLTRNGVQGIILVFLCLLLFMNARVSFITSLGAPIAFMVAFSLMDSMGVTLNLISMFGLILVLGMLVDDSIIVSEHFYQYVEKGMDTKKAAFRAAVETVKPVTATVLTTMVAFGSLFFMGGIMGKFLWPVPAVVIICLTASWLECFFILPSHLADFVKSSKNGVERTWYRPLLNKYQQLITISLKHNFLVIIVFVVLFFTSLIIAKNMRFELFPSEDTTAMFVDVKGKVGTPFEVTNLAMKKLEDVIDKELKEDELELARTLVGSQVRQQGNRTGSHYGGIILYLTMADLRERGNSRLIADLIPKLKNAVMKEGFEVSLRAASNGPPKGKAVNIELHGEELDEIKKYSKIVEADLAKISGVETTEIDYEEGKKQLVIMVDDAEARRLGLTASQIAFELRRAYEGDAVTEIRKSDEDIDIRVRLNKETRSQVNQLDQIFVVNNSGRRIRLSQVASIMEEPGAFIIRRMNRKRTISVSAELDRDTTTSVEVNRIMKQKMESILAGSGVKFTLSGENKDTKDSVQRLAKAGMIAMFCIFIILVAMFSSMIESAIIMSAIPFGLIGVVFTFLLFGKPFGFMALMGIIGLVGVVVNDSIVLVTFINQRLKTDKMDALSAIIDGALSRFRPVVLTTFTTVAGLLPIAHAPGGDPFLKPMALSFAYGLIFSTSITLIFIPASYLSYVKFMNWWTKFRKKEQHFELGNFDKVKLTIAHAGE